MSFNHLRAAYEYNHSLSPQSVLLGKNIRLPIIGIGSGQGTDEEVQRVTDAALEAGYRHVDTARSYGSEEAIGKVLKKWFGSGKLKREEVFITTKCNITHFRPEHIEKSLNESLSALGLDYVDLFLAHNPVGLQYVDTGFPMSPEGDVLIDTTTDITANWKVMESMVDKGKTRAIGLSNFNQKQVKRIIDAARIPPVNNQIELYVYLQQPELVRFCKTKGVTICAYGPIGAPYLQEWMKSMKGAESNYYSPMQDPVVLEITKKCGKSPAQVLLRFLVQYGVAVIPRSSKPERVKENINIFDFELSEGDYKKLKALDKGEIGRQFKGSPAFKNHPEYPYES